MAKEFNQYKLPENWIWVELGDILETTSGGTPSRGRPDYYNGTIPWVKSGELNYNIITKTEEKITDAALQSSSAKLFPKGTLLVALYGATVGRLAFLGIDASTNQAVCGIFQNSNINIKYIYYCLMNQYSYLISLSAGGAQPNISQTIIKKVNIPLPPLNEQNRIVEKLDELLSELEKGKEQLQTSLEQLKVYRQSILKHAFEGKMTEGEVGNNDWEIIRTGTVLDVRDGTHDTPKYIEKSGIPLITSKNLKNGKIDFNDIKFISSTDHENISKRSKVNTGDVLFAMIGTIGNPVVVVGEPNFSIKNVGLFKKNESIILPKFLKYFLESTVFEKQMQERKLLKGTTQKFIPLGNLRDINIPIPKDINLQHKIVELIEAKLSHCDNIESISIQSLKELEVLKKSLLQKAFEGKLVEQDSTDEPASKLLERIKKEREEFLKAEKERKKTEKPLYIKTRKMAEELKRIIEILKESKEPVSAKTLWQSSTHKDDIDDFYAALKKHIEAGEIIELPRKGKESFLKLADAK